MSLRGLLLIAALVVPLAMTMGCFSPRVRERVLSLLPFAPLPALLAALWGPADRVVLFPEPFRMTLLLDQPGAILLGGAALLWAAAGTYAASYMRETGAPTRFAVSWLLTMTGSMGLFIVADIASFYLLFTMASLAAYGLIAHEETPRAFRASSVYVGLALVGEAFLLLALVWLATASPEANPLIHEVVRELPTSPHRDGILALVLLGCALKLGLVPLHVWLPLAHPAAPMPASAVLSGVLVKAGVIGLIRFLPYEAPLPAWGDALVAVGLVTAYWGVAVGITQTQAKTVLAYSTVSQMGLIAAIAGAGLSTGDTQAPDLAAYYGVHHMLAKGGLFLGVGIIAATGAARLRPVLALTAVLAISLGGLPLTSGALAKLASKPLFGYGLIYGLVTLAAVGSTVLMLHFLALVSQKHAADPQATPPRAQMMPWLVVAGASLTIPWLLFPGLSGNTIRSALEVSSLWKSAWPVGLGVLLALALRRYRERLPALPEGDIIALMERGSPALERAGRALERCDGVLRQWLVGGALLLGISVLLGAALLAAR
jgi:formate hydrogenlyase subunit 3/multisubunit Na+/H+ antiporter MnhD subunit